MNRVHRSFATASAALISVTVPSPTLKFAPEPTVERMESLTSAFSRAIFFSSLKASFGYSHSLSPDSSFRNLFDFTVSAPSIGRITTSTTDLTIDRSTTCMNFSASFLATSAAMDTARVAPENAFSSFLDFQSL